MRKLLLGLVGIVCALFATSSYAATTCKNLFDGQIEQGGIQFADGRTTSQTIYLYSVNPIPVTPNTSYVLSADTNIIKKGEIYFYKNNGEYIGHINTLQTLPRTFATPENAYQVKFILTGSGEDLQPSDATNVQLEQGSTATAYVPYVAACHKIQVATTKYVESEFAPMNTALAAAVATVNTVVTNTINQAASIATLQSGKQTRPDETCPAGKKCLLVEGTDGKPHWYEIVENALPSGYTELEYIRFDGSQYIITNYTMDQASNPKVELKIKNKQGAAFGAQNDNSRSIVDFSSQLYCGAGANRLSYTLPDDDAVHTLSGEYNTNTTVLSVYIDGVLQTSGEQSGSFSTNRLSFGNINGGTGGTRLSGDVYSFKVYQNNTLVLNLVPAQRNSDNVIGMYDTVSGQFFTNQGTGEFTAGPVAE